MAGDRDARLGGQLPHGVPRRLAFELAEDGFPVMAVNTRPDNNGLFFGGGLFHTTPLDIEAAVEVAAPTGSIAWFC